MKNVFVGNMSFQTTETELRSMFEPFGEITRVSVVTDRDTGRARGFGLSRPAGLPDKRDSTVCSTCSPARRRPRT